MVLEKEWYTLRATLYHYNKRVYGKLNCTARISIVQPPKLVGSYRASVNAIELNYKLRGKVGAIHGLPSCVNFDDTQCERVRL